MEIDEFKFVSKKYNKGRKLKNQGKWLFGGIERESGHCFLEFVDKRDR